MAVYSRRITWIDVNGASRTTVVLGNATMAAVEVALLNLSWADWTLDSEAQVFSNAAPTPQANTYQSVTDQAVLWFSTATGEIVQITLPAPRSTIFMADGLTVDPTSVAGLLAVATGLVITPGGAPITGFVGGTRTRVP